MRALQVVSLTGPSDLVVDDVAEPVPGDGDVLIEVHRVGVAFPDLLMSRGEYQLKPELPFTLGVDVAGTVVSGPDFAPGQRVVAVGGHGGAQERVALPATFAFPLPDALSFDEGAALPMNYLTAEFALHERGGLREGEVVLVHGAAGGLGTATVQVAKGMGARVIGVVSTEEKADVARAAGADDVVPLDGFKDAVGRLVDGVDLVADIVGGPAFLDSLRCLRRQGRLIVLGFASGLGIPEVKVNRLLLNNIDVRGAAWGEFAMTTPGYLQEQWSRLLPMIESGAVRPPVGRVYELAEFGQALVDLDERRALGKLVVRVRD